VRLEDCAVREGILFGGARKPEEGYVNGPSTWRTEKKNQKKKKGRKKKKRISRNGVALGREIQSRVTVKETRNGQRSRRWREATQEEEKPAAVERLKILLLKGRKKVYGFWWIILGNGYRTCRMAKQKMLRLVRAFAKKWTSKGREGVLRKDARFW